MNEPRSCEKLACDCVGGASGGGEGSDTEAAINGYLVKLKSLSDLNRLLPDSAQHHPPAVNETHNGKGKAVRISLETKGRKGKCVTMVSGLQPDPATMKDIARILKEHCGTARTMKHGNIELQADQHDRATGELQKMNYVVERA